ncbi:MAG: hypothetical protein R3B52_00100 [Candidatus Paceibacterota bacterium]
MKSAKATLLVSALTLLVPVVAFAQASSASFDNDSAVINSVGQLSTSTNFQVIGNMPYIEGISVESTNFGVSPSGFSGLSGGGGGGATPTPSAENTGSSGYFDETLGANLDTQKIYEIIRDLLALLVGGPAQTVNTQQQATSTQIVTAQDSGQTTSDATEPTQEEQTSIQYRAQQIFFGNRTLSFYPWYIPYISSQLLPWFVLLIVILFLLGSKRREKEV